MDQSRGLHRVSCALAAKVLPRHAPQFFIYQRYQLFKGSFVTMCPLKEQLCDVV
jgi:hypothetical protein